VSHVRFATTARMSEPSHRVPPDAAALQAPLARRLTRLSVWSLPGSAKSYSATFT
jgi:hypothetical protein